MATSNPNTTSTAQDTGDVSWWREILNDPNAQNALASLLQGQIEGDQASTLNNGLAQQQAVIREAIGNNSYNMPRGMDFSPYLPLQRLIHDTSYSRENAIADTQGFIDEIFRQYETESLPQIYRNPRASGIYNDTSTQLLANDAYSTAVAKGQAAISQNILNYAQARQAQLNPVMQLMQGQVSNSNQLISAQAGLEQQRMAGNVSLAGLLAGNVGQQAANNAQAGANRDTRNITTGISAIQAGINAYDRWRASQTQDPAPVDNRDFPADTSNDDYDWTTDDQDYGYYG